MHEGGWVMWVILALSIAMIVIAIRFLLDPTPARLAVLRALSRAQVLTTLGGTATNFIMVCKSAIRDFDQSGHIKPELLILGTGEALSPLSMGFTMLAFAWLIIALAVRKAHEPPI